MNLDEIINSLEKIPSWMKERAIKIVKSDDKEKSGMNCATIVRYILGYSEDPCCISQEEQRGLIQFECSPILHHYGI